MKTIVNNILKIIALAVLYVLLCVLHTKYSRGWLYDLIDDVQQKDFL